MSTALAGTWGRSPGFLLDHEQHWIPAALGGDTSEMSQAWHRNLSLGPVVSFSRALPTWNSQFWVMTAGWEAEIPGIPQQAIPKGLTKQSLHSHGCPTLNPNGFPASSNSHLDPWEKEIPASPSQQEQTDPGCVLLHRPLCPSCRMAFWEGSWKNRSAGYFRTLFLQNGVILKSGIPGQGSGDVQKMERSRSFHPYPKKPQ